MQRNLFFLLLISGVIVLAGCGKSAPEPANPALVSPPPPVKFVVAGSGTNLPITVKLAEEYTKISGVPCEVPPSIGSDGAIAAVKAGAVELGLLSRPPHPARSGQRAEGRPLCAGGDHLRRVAGCSGR